MNANATVFVPTLPPPAPAPAPAAAGRVKKTKEERGPRKRRRKNKGAPDYASCSSLNEDGTTSYNGGDDHTDDRSYSYDEDDFSAGDFRTFAATHSGYTSSETSVAAQGDAEDDSLGPEGQLDWGAWFDSIVDRFGPSSSAMGGSPPISFAHKYSALWAQPDDASVGRSSTASSPLPGSTGRDPSGGQYGTSASGSFACGGGGGGGGGGGRYDDFVAQLVAESDPSSLAGGGGGDGGQMSWLELHREWSFSKLHLVEVRDRRDRMRARPNSHVFLLPLVPQEDELIAEALERKKWGMWAMHAAEKERQRRISALEEIDAAQELERQARARWALEAIEKERHDRVSNQFLNSLASTNWFNETIDKGRYSEDYELVCPYYRMGCKQSCRRSTLEKHLQQECYFAQQMKLMDAANLVGSSGSGSGSGSSNTSNHDTSTGTGSGTGGDDFRPDDYEIVCPYAFMGCTYTCRRTTLHAHLLECAHSGLGLSKERDLEERMLTQQAVILECEVRRALPCPPSLQKPLSAAPFSLSDLSRSASSPHGAGGAPAQAAAPHGRVRLLERRRTRHRQRQGQGEGRQPDTGRGRRQGRQGRAADPRRRESRPAAELAVSAFAAAGAGGVRHAQLARRGRDVVGAAAGGATRATRRVRRRAGRDPRLRGEALAFLPRGGVWLVRHGPPRPQQRSRPRRVFQVRPYPPFY